jgi:hypothetical protein
VGKGIWHLLSKVMVVWVVRGTVRVSTWRSSVASLGSQVGISRGPRPVPVKVAENPPQPPFAKGGAQRGFGLAQQFGRTRDRIPPFAKGGEGGFSELFTVNSHSPRLGGDFDGAPGLQIRHRIPAGSPDRVNFAPRLGVELEHELAKPIHRNPTR